MRWLQEQARSLGSAREGQHLFNNVGSALGAGFDGGKNHHIRLRHFGPAQNRRPHQDGGKNIIEVVRHPAGQRTDAFQPLGPEELFLDLFLLGDVGVDDENGFGRPSVIPDQCPTAPNCDMPPVLAEVGAFPGPFSIFENGCSRGSHVDRVAFTKKSGPCPAPYFRARPTVQFFRAHIPKFNAVFHVPHHDRVLGEIEQAGLFSDLCFAGASGCFPVFALGHVQHNSTLSDRLPRSADHVDAIFDPDFPSAGRNHPILQFCRMQFRIDRNGTCDCFLPIVRVQVVSPKSGLR
jgi:hypothetical protein